MDFIAGRLRLSFEEIEVTDSGVWPEFWQLADP